MCCRKRKTNIETISLVKEIEVDDDEDEFATLKKNDDEIDMEIEKGFLNESEAIWLRGANRIAHQVNQLKNEHSLPYKCFIEIIVFYFSSKLLMV